MKFTFFILTSIALFTGSAFKALGQQTGAAPGTGAAAEEVYRKIFPKASGKDFAEQQPLRGMYHKGDIVFTPMGQLDGYAVASKQFEGLLIYSLDKSGSLAKAGLKRWDVIYKVNGKSLGKVSEKRTEPLVPIVNFGEALLEQEKTGKSLTVSIRRNAFSSGKPEEKVVKLNVRKLGGFAPFTTNGKLVGRSRKHSEDALSTILKTQLRDGSWKCIYGSQLSTSLAGVNLIMVAESFPSQKSKILRSLKSAVDFLDKKEEWLWSWDHAAATWFLAEYFWATGDTKAYKTLHRYLGMLDHSVNPVGGVCHKPMIAPYKSINMGAPSGLASIALKVADRCKCAFNRGTTTELMDFQLYGYLPAQALKKRNLVGYMGYLANNTNVGETAFTSAVHLVGVHRNDYGDQPFADIKKQTIPQIHELLQKCHTQISDIHATPALGTLFGSLAFSTFAEDSTTAWENSLLQKRVYQLVLSEDSKEKFHYAYPRYARMALPGGGGWNGDDIMGKDHLTALISISLLNTSFKNLVANGGDDLKPIGWLSRRESKTCWRDVEKFHQSDIKSLARKISNIDKKGDTSVSLGLVNTLLDTYPPEVFKSIYTSDSLSIMESVIREAEKKKINPKDSRSSAAAAFLNKVYSGDPKNVLWKKRLNEFLKSAGKKDWKNIKARFQKLPSK